MADIFHRTPKQPPKIPGLTLWPLALVGVILLLTGGLCLYVEDLQRENRSHVESMSLLSKHINESAAEKVTLIDRVSRHQREAIDAKDRLARVEKDSEKDRAESQKISGLVNQLLKDREDWDKLMLDMSKKIADASDRDFLAERATNFSKSIDKLTTENKVYLARIQMLEASLRVKGKEIRVLQMDLKDYLSRPIAEPEKIIIQEWIPRRWWQR